MEEVGLDYLALDRSAKTLSGGETQRIRLSAQLGSNLRGVLYVLDEPTIGLHPRDNNRLLDTLEALRSKGNSLIVVEHDDETMRRADYILDLGPGPGVHGGEVVAQGTLPEIMADARSVTGRFLSKPIKHPMNGARRAVDGKTAAEKWIELKGSSANNLQDVDVRFPVGRLSVITGISGSGKSTLMRSPCCCPPRSWRWRRRARRRRKPPRARRSARRIGRRSRGRNTWRRFTRWTRRPSARPRGRRPRRMWGCWTRSGRCSRSCPVADARVWLRPVFVQHGGRAMRELPGAGRDQARDEFFADELRAVRGLRRAAVQRADFGGALQRQEHRAGVEPDHRAGGGVLRGGGEDSPSTEFADPDRVRLPQVGAAESDAERRRGTTHEAGDGTDARRGQRAERDGCAKCGR